MAQDNLLGELMETIQSFSRLAAYSQVASLAKGEIYLLTYLQKHGGQSMPADLCADLDISKARVSAELGILEDKGYVVRAHDQSDKRRLHISLTPMGEKYILQKKTAACEKIKEIMDRMGEDDLREYMRLTRKFMTIASGLNQKAKEDIR